MSLDHDTLIEGFYRNELSNEEREAFVELLRNDSEFQEKVKIEKHFFENLNPEEWDFVEPHNPGEVAAYQELFRSEEIKNLRSILEESRSNFKNSKSPTPKHKYLFVAAATIALCISIFAWLNGNPTSADLYSDYMDLSELPSLVERGDSTNDKLVQAQQLFEGGDYIGTLNILNNEILSSEEVSSNVYIYKGVAEMQLDRLEDGRLTFESLADSDLLDASKGYWYKALIFVKQDRIEEATKLLEEIVSKQFYNYDEASKLLIQLQ